MTTLAKESPWTPEALADSDLNRLWDQLTRLSFERFGERLKVEGLLLMIGLQELQQSQLMDRNISKERKMDLMHVGMCTVLEPAGYYERLSNDADGWPQWELIRPLPHMDILQQGKLLRYALVRYFSDWLAESSHQESL